MIVFIAGPMFSSKSKRMIEYYNGATYNGKDNVLVFKPELDIRDDGIISTRSGEKIPAIKIKSLFEIKDYITEKTTDIFIDEVNFFENIPNSEVSNDFFIEREKRIHKIILMFEYLNYKKEINIFLSGLVFNSERKPFGIAPYLLSIANSIDNLNARCVKCNSLATHSNYKTVKDIEVVVGTDQYEALCSRCWFKAQEKKDKEFLKNIFEK